MNDDQRPAPARRLWLVRHALPMIDKGVCYGRHDIPADETATAVCARGLAEVLPAAAHIRHSPLRRCAQLADALAAIRPDLPSTPDDRLQEMDFGRWENTAWLDIAPGELAAWTEAFADHAAGTTGETVTGFMARVASAFDDERRLGGPRDAVWITHAGVIRAVSLLACGVRHVERADQWPLDAPEYGQWRTLALQSV